LSAGSTPPPDPPAGHSPRGDKRDRVGDPAFWDEYYQQGTPPWDKGEPAPPLVELWETLGFAPGAMLVPGCGSAADAVHFAQLGCTVTAVDIADEAIARARARAEEHGVAIEVHQGDVCALPAEWAAKFDYVLEHTCYCAISPDARDGYVAEMARVLKPGGWLLGLFFHHGFEGGPPWHIPEEDLRSRFPGPFRIERLEPAEGSFEKRRGKELIALLQRGRA
jgi:SAM-dependent methyltransferase